MKLTRLLLILFCAPVFAAFTATITFTPPTTYTDGSTIPGNVPLTYNLYQQKDGGAMAKVKTFSGSSTTVDTGLTAGTYCWEVTSVANSVESARSNKECKTFVLTPSAVTITVT